MSDERKNVGTEMRKVSCKSFPEIFARDQSLAAEFGDLSPDGLIQAFRGITGFGSLYTPNPIVQNQRVKGISTRPANYNTEQVAKMIETPEQNEKPLRAVEHALEFTAYPLQHIRWTYQNLLTYHSYVAPSLTDKGDAEKDAFWREWRLLEKLRKEIGRAHV